LTASSAFASDVYKPVVRKGKASEKELMWAGRIVILLVAIAAIIILSSPEASSIMGLVTNAWGVFGAAFGPAIILSLFWSRFNYSGAIAGIVAGAAIDIFWMFLMKDSGIYELLPGFFGGLIVAVIATLVTPKPSKDVYKLYRDAVEYKD
jgi:sodium/proline symporter